MTTPTPRWTAETEELAWQTLVASGSNSWRERLDASRAARQLLIALADAGVLIPVGGETRQEWRAVNPDGTGMTWTTRPRPEWLVAIRADYPHARFEMRTVSESPWREVTDDPA